VVLGTSVSVPVTDTYVYIALGDPLELIRQPPWRLMLTKLSAVMLRFLSAFSVRRKSCRRCVPI